MIYAAPSGSANDKLRVGLIGAGNRAKWLTRALSRESHRAELVAICDCYLPQIDLLAADNKSDPQAGAAWKRYQNYEQMFDQKELDAVIIATPDHVRVRAAIIACAKGLDVYAEKPLSFSIPEGRALVKAVRKHKRVLQVGTQQRSTANNQYSCEFVRNGGLGKVHTILVKNYSGARGATGLDNGQWNKLRVLAVGPRIQTWINDKPVADVTDGKVYATYPSGVIALQVHGVKNSPEKPRHVSIRSIRVRRLESAK